MCRHDGYMSSAGPSAQSEVAQHDHASSTGAATTAVECSRRPEFETQGGSSRVNPDIAVETAHPKVLQLGQALALMADCSGPAVEVSKQELEKAKAASKKSPVDVEQCPLLRAETRVSELDAERTAEMASLAEDRLQRLEAEQAATTSLPQEAQGPLNPPAEWASQIVSLRAKLPVVEGERDSAQQNQDRRPATMSNVAAAASTGGGCPVPTTRVLSELGVWLQSCHVCQM